MRLIGLEVLSMYRSDPSVALWLRSWITEVKCAHWKHESDLFKQFPNARGVDDGRFVFLAKGLSIAVILRVAFPQGIAVIEAFDKGGDADGS